VLPRNWIALQYAAGVIKFRNIKVAKL